MIYETYSECFSREKDHHHIKEKARCAEAASAIICPSKSAIGEAQKHYELDGKAMAVIPHAVDPVFLPKCQEDQLNTFRDKYTENHPFVMFVGSRLAHKNFIGLLAAYSRWKSKKKFHLLAIGGGAPSRYELSVVNCLGVSDLVHFCDDLDEEGLTIAYNSAKAVIVPSLSEGFGFPVLEAMACGTPVASSTGGSLPEVGGNIPFYFDPQNNDQLVDALEEVIQISIDLHRIQEGIHRARERTWEQVAEEYTQVYRSIIDE
jgi:glycosyltransferase involved in cell wall biosynthesis